MELPRHKHHKITKDQYVASEVYEYFRRQFKFGHIISIVRRIGSKAVFELMSEVKQSNCKDPKALFLWKCSQIKIVFKQV